MSFQGIELEMDAVTVVRQFEPYSRRDLTAGLICMLVAPLPCCGMLFQNSHCRGYSS